MDLVELVNELKTECSVSGAPIATTRAQSGETARLILWVNKAYEQVQNQFFDWKFLAKRGTFKALATATIINPPADLNIWDRLVYDDNGAQIGLEPRTENDDYFQRNAGRPSRFIVNEDNTLTPMPTPDGEYSYSFTYYRKPHKLLADRDQPLIPEQFQRIIVAGAMILYANFESAVELRQQGMEQYANLYGALVNHQTADKQQTYGRAAGERIVISVDE